jgi:chemotaxis protein histidine kinase CheA
MIKTPGRVALPTAAHQKVERRIGTVDDLMREFLTESNENLSRLNQEIVEIEKSPDDMEILNSIFRTIHTIKGTCGFLGL